MIIQDVISHLETFAPTQYAEGFDNVGLLVGNKKNKLTGVLVTLDTIEAVVDEAITNQCNLIVSFHPIIFKGLKKLTGKTYVERTVQKAIQHNIAIFAIHTALDNNIEGVNAILSKTLGIENTQILIPQQQTIKKLTTYAPKAEAEQLRTALFNAGAGSIGNYTHCSYNTDGIGSYKANLGANPTKGKHGEIHFEEETQINMVFPKHLESPIIEALIKNHSYEEVAYEITTLENVNKNIGMGMIGTLKQPLNENDFFQLLKEKLNPSLIRHSATLGKTISKVAVLGGSGSFAITAAIASGADAFVTSDLKYHDFFSAENKIILADVGHYESEQYTKNAIVAHLTKKITNFAIILSQTNTNPVKYF